MKIVRLIIVAATLASFAGAMTGCNTTDAENVSSRPWNTPKNWENGLPSSMSEGR